MKTKNKNISLRQLFRKKLETAEVVPDALVKSKLMRRVARREFMRFNPIRLNIYYVTGIVVAGITMAVLLVTISKTSGNSIPQSSTNVLKKDDSTGFIEIQANQLVRKEPEKPGVTYSESPKNNFVPKLHKNSDPEAKRDNKLQKTNTLLHADISNSLSNKGVVSEGAVDKKTLQTGFNAGTNLIEPLELSGCAPLKVKFYNKLISYDSCRWTFGDGGYSNEKDPEWIFDVEGEYKIVLQAFNKDGTNSISAATVTVYPKPRAQFEITPEKAVLPNDEIHFMNYSTNSVQFKWDFGDGSTSEFFEPSHTYANYSSYDVRLVVFSDKGCSDTIKVINAFSRSEYFIDFPNAFIPNTQGPSGGYYSSKSDEAAQVFHPSYTGVTEYHLKIFSKLGILIFESSDINLGWDGYLKGQLCESGVYIWKVRGKFRNGEPFIKMGDVTLLKN